MRPSCSKQTTREKQEGAGNAGCALHPRPRVRKKSTRVSNHRYTASTGIPCTMVLTVSFVISPVTGLFCHRHFAGIIPRTLAPASGRQDHTTSPSASAPLVLRRCRVHRIPYPTSVTIAIRPSCGNGTARVVSLIWGKREAEYFCAQGWTGFRARRPICPSGSHTMVSCLEELTRAVPQGTSLRGANGSRECAPDDRLRDEDSRTFSVALESSLALAMTRTLGHTPRMRGIQYAEASHSTKNAAPSPRLSDAGRR